ncbi:MAG: TetR/AcrR family transcriptional regulator [Acidimicrobiales bacterium]|nr:TetR/AcrR family transcriptional regulator [Acidimicrobiales bacterium]
MTSPRSRQASQAETRSRLLQVAEEILAEQGYQRASLEKIAERAGFTKGAVYSNFASKEDLTLAVLDSHFADFLNDLERRLNDAAPTLSARVEALAGWWRDIVLHERWGVVILELAGATRDRPAFQEALAEREQMIFDFCTYLVQAEMDQFGLELEMTAREIAEALVTMGIGIAFARSLDPKISADTLARTAQALMVR